jgi:hypothetical protein
MENSINPSPVHYLNKLRPLLFASVFTLLIYTFILDNSAIQKQYRCLKVINEDENNFYKNISNNQYSGLWSSIDTPIGFDKTKGKAEFFVNKRSRPYSLDNNDAIYVKIYIWNDEYFDRWYSIRGKFYLNESNAMTSNDSLVLILNSTIVEGRLFDVVNETNSISNLLRCSNDY